MKLSQYVRNDLIITDLRAKDKADALRRMAAAFREAGLIRDEKVLFESIMTREKVMTTGIGEGLAIPHTFLGEIQDMAIAVAVLGQELDFQSLDQRPVKMIVMIVANDQRPDLSLKALAGITRMVCHTALVRRLAEATDPGEVFSVLQESEGQITHH
jgi:fructose-specific phosphotransferase system IIA component